MMLTRRKFSAASLTLAAMPLSAQGAPMPTNICDCHNHIIGPPARYPMLADRAYTPPEASVADLLALRARTGIARNVIIQPSLYGFDNRCMLDALGTLGASARGIAVVQPEIADVELADMSRRGVRGLRLNFESVGKRGPVEAAEALEVLAPRAHTHDLHLQLYTVLPVIAAIDDRIAALPVPVVIDHFGMPRAEKGVGQDGFGALLDLVRAKKVYVKLSAPYRISDAPGYADVAPIARALIEAGHDRLVWATDWPHTNRSAPSPTRVSPFRVVDDVAGLALITQWCDNDQDLLALILAKTPAALYRF